MSTNKTKIELEISDVALELFKVRAAHSGVGTRQLAMGCFRDAAAFINIAKEVNSSDVDLLAEETNPLDPAFAPNLNKTHPINLMSRSWGDLKKVQNALSDLNANPAAESYEPYGWTKSEIRQARALFPAVIERSKQIAITK